MLLAHLPLVDPEVQAEVERALHNIQLKDVLLDTWEIKDYINAVISWLESSSHNVIAGLEYYPHKAYCVGSIDGIQSFIHRHVTQRRIRFSRAEFVASKIVSNHAVAKWAFLEDDELREGDALVVSLPFSGNGSRYSVWNKLMEECQQLNIPVLVDMAYYGISHGIKFDLSPNCITDVVTSLSKPLNVQLRLGLRMTREYHDDLIQGNSDSKIINRIAAQVGIELMKKFPHDYIISKYREKGEEICRKLNLTPSNTITLALGNEHDHKDFFRNGYYRVCITNELLQDV
jgi:hypothetical protein